MKEINLRCVWCGHETKKSFTEITFMDNVECGNCGVQGRVKPKPVAATYQKTKVICPYCATETKITINLMPHTDFLSERSESLGACQGCGIILAQGL